MKLVCLLLLLAVHCALSSKYSRKKTYHNDIVATCNSKNDARVRTMMKDDSVDVWKIHPSGTVEMRMNRDLYMSIQGYVQDICYVSIQNVEVHIQEAEAQMMSDWQRYSGQMVSSQENKDAQWFEEYHDLAAITSWYERLAKANPKLVKIVRSIGKSTEGRDISAVHITAQTSNYRKPKFYVQCLIHAREWISGCVCMHQVQSLVQGYSKDEKITNLLHSMEFVVVPVVNPDGYHFSWSDDRMWRKNRAQLQGHCRGVDLNRNFPVGWGNDGGQCAQTYAGTHFASEPETQAIINYYKANGPFVGAIDFHSYGQLILRPWGFEKEKGEDEPLMARVGSQLADDIKEISGQAYTSETSHDLYEAHGIASDWLYSREANNGHTALAYTIELRDHGDQGFLLPQSEIKATCEEVNKAFLHLAEMALSRYQMMTA